MEGSAASGGISSLADVLAKHGLQKELRFKFMFEATTDAIVYTDFLSLCPCEDLEKMLDKSPGAAQTPPQGAWSSAS